MRLNNTVDIHPKYPDREPRPLPDRQWMLEHEMLSLYAVGVKPAVYRRRTTSDGLYVIVECKVSESVDKFDLARVIVCPKAEEAMTCVGADELLIEEEAERHEGDGAASGGGGGGGGAAAAAGVVGGLAKGKKCSVGYSKGDLKMVGFVRGIL